MIDRKRTACFTGHRDIPESRAEILKKLLDITIEQLYGERRNILWGWGKLWI